MLSALALTSCNNSSNEEVNEVTTEKTDESNDDIVKTTSVDQAGNTLDVTYNNTKGTATLSHDGETVVLESERPASGIWYKSGNFELSGKGEEIELKKNEEVVFSNVNDIVKTTATNAAGETMEMSYNNTKGEVTVYFKGEMIEMKSEKPASGIWYTNDQYELRGKGEQVELKKDDKSIFKN